MPLTSKSLRAFVKQTLALALGLPEIQQPRLVGGILKRQERFFIVKKRP